MATDRQVEANRLNALKSTGPTSVEGKLRSRSNALVHGMAGEAGFVENGSVDAYQLRRDDWAACYGVLDSTQEFALDCMIAASVRIEQCENAIESVIARHSLRAELAWDVDQRLVAATVGSKLAKNPRLVCRQLEATRHGCALMIELWAYIGKNPGEWSEVLVGQALDLLGVPLDAREGPTLLDPRSGVKRGDHQAAIFASETKRLQALVVELTPIDGLDRSQEMEGSVALLSKNAQLLMRYEREAWRQFNQCAKELKSAVILAEPAPAPARTPAPLPKPAPAPVPVAVAPRQNLPHFNVPANDQGYSYVNISATPARAPQRT